MTEIILRESFIVGVADALASAGDLDTFLAWASVNAAHRSCVLGRPPSLWNAFRSRRWLFTVLDHKKQVPRCDYDLITCNLLGILPQAAETTAPQKFRDAEDRKACMLLLANVVKERVLKAYPGYKMFSR
jgi:hypothetical protein